MEPSAASRRVRRNRWIALVLAALIVAGLVIAFNGGNGPTTGPPHRPPSQHSGTGAHVVKDPELDPDWQGDGKAVTFAFGGDVNFPSGSTLGDRLAADPATALGTGVPALLSGVNLSMVNFESALTNGNCPQPQPKSYVFYAPPAAVTAFRSANVSLVSEANNHGEDCGPPGLQMSLSIRNQSGYTILGLGQNASDAFTPFRTTIDGQRITILAATQVIDSDLQTTWTATTAQPGLASAYDVDDLVAAVEAARKDSDTVIVFLHWGIELQTCPDPDQEPLANVLVAAGADIVVGSHAHVLLGGGYLGSAYVDYGLGNFAFYNDPPPTNQSGALVITATGRTIDNVTWRPAVIENELPVPLSGAAATQATTTWSAARNCTDLSATPSTSLATTQSETSPAPAAAAAQLSVDG
jgi:poly-gamma-glutamate synthesis protein (capsule biosynthesis protein)